MEYSTQSHTLTHSHNSRTDRVFECEIDATIDERVYDCVLIRFNSVREQRDSILLMSYHYVSNCNNTINESMPPPGTLFHTRVKFGSTPRARRAFSMSP